MAVTRVYGYRVREIVLSHECGSCSRHVNNYHAGLITQSALEALRRDCGRCGGTGQVRELSWEAVIVRNGVDTWRIAADTREAAIRDANRWLDEYKPGWRREGAYEGEIA